MSSLYLHIPFCAGKCPYCDFFSQPGDEAQLARYTDLLIHNIDVLQQTYPQHDAFSTIYFGGGTPSLLNTAQVDRILAEIDRTFGIRANAEITLEANPGTIAQRQLDGYRRTGINRLSLGLQSLSDDNLKMLGRRHDSRQACDCVTMARRAGFDNLSLDLMFALPGQSVADLQDELTRLLALHPEHISIYGLTYEEGTEFERLRRQGVLTECSEELYAEQYHQIHERLTAAGFDHYEISNFARPGRACRHNQTYWQRKTCLAVGAGAHGFDAEGWGRRWYIPPDLERYRAQLNKSLCPALTLETFDRQQAMQESCYLALRTSAGVFLPDFEETFGCRAEEVFATAFAQAGPFLNSEGQRVFFGPDGWLLYDHLISAFL